jgi:hypothetical protein
LELVAFDEYCRFDTSAFFMRIKRGSLYTHKESRSIKTAIFIESYQFQCLGFSRGQECSISVEIYSKKGSACKMHPSLRRLNIYVGIQISPSGYSEMPDVPPGRKLEVAFEVLSCADGRRLCDGAWILAPVRQA